VAIPSGIRTCVEVRVFQNAPRGSGQRLFLRVLASRPPSGVLVYFPSGVPIRDSPEPPPKIGKSVSRPDPIPNENDSEDGQAAACCRFRQLQVRFDFRRPRRGCGGGTRSAEGLDTLAARAWDPPRRVVGSSQSGGEPPGGARPARERAETVVARRDSDLSAGSRLLAMRQGDAQDARMIGATGK